jgi:sec-independent protein translocase protein TatA
MFGFGFLEIFILVLLGVLIFGKRFPEVGRSVAKTLMDLKRTYKGFEDSLKDGTLDSETFRPQLPPPPPPPPVRTPQRVQPIGQKFEDLPGSQS